MSTFLYKRPSNLPFDANVNDGNTTVLFEWKSNEFGPYNQRPYILDSRVSPTPFMLATFYGDDYNDYNRAFGAGQTFKLQIGSGFSGDDYYPLAYTPAELN